MIRRVGSRVRGARRPSWLERMRSVARKQQARRGKPRIGRGTSRARSYVRGVETVRKANPPSTKTLVGAPGTRQPRVPRAYKQPVVKNKQGAMSEWRRKLAARRVKFNVPRGAFGRASDLRPGQRRRSGSNRARARYSPFLGRETRKDIQALGKRATADYRKRLAARRA